MTEGRVGREGRKEEEEDGGRGAIAVNVKRGRRRRSVVGGEYEDE